MEPYPDSFPLSSSLNLEDLQTTSRTESKVLVIYTGGTIGMLPSPTGLKPSKGFLAQQLLRLPAFNDQDLGRPYTTPVSRFGKRVHYDIKEWDNLMDSSNSKQKSPFCFCRFSFSFFIS